MPRYTVVGLGELLWDLFGDHPRLGGAPANVAYHATLLGDQGVVATCVGRDERGDRAIRFLRDRNVDVSVIQQDGRRPTGVAKVTLDGDGVRFEIAQDAAWMTPRWTDAWEALFRRTQVLCFGTLLCARDPGREVLERAAASIGEDGWRILDLNLRPPLDSDEAIDTALGCANAVKLNATEARTLAERYAAPDPARWLVVERGMRVVAVTRGARGSVLYRGDERVDHPGCPLSGTQGDPVGAGDAFTAALAHHLVRGHPLATAGEAANRYAARVASLPGAMPPMEQEQVRERAGGPSDS